MRWVPPGLLLLVALATTATGRADTPSREELAAAEAAFDEGKRLSKAGKTATAWGTFRAAAAAARSKGNAGREREARARAVALEPKLSKLRIVVPDDAR